MTSGRVIAADVDDDATSRNTITMPRKGVLRLIYVTSLDVGEVNLGHIFA